MTRPAAWKYVLDESRRQALVAVDFYNRPNGKRSFSDFVVHMHLAWQNLLHAHRMKHKLELYYRDKKRFVRLADGSKKTWDLHKCLQEEFDDSSPVKQNLLFFIGLRNHIEHHFQDTILQATTPETHAYVINFENELVARFGLQESLGDELQFPIFIHSLRPADYEKQRALRRSLPKHVVSYITEFQKAIPDPALLEDERYSYRLLLTPIKGPKTDADIALNFVRADSLTQEDKDGILGGEGSVIIVEKTRDVLHKDAMRPGVAAAAVNARVPFHFGLHEFTTLRKIWEVGPESSKTNKLLAKTTDQQCIYSPAFSAYVYLPAFVEKIVKEVGTIQGYEQVMGKPPREESK